MTEHPSARGRADNALAAGPLGQAIDWAIGPRGLRDLRQLRKSVDGRVVVVTGASYGVGEATARLFAAAGATVILGARSIGQLEQVASEIRAEGGKAVALQLDLADEQSIADFAEQITEEYGAPEVLVHNAGKSLRRSIHLSYNRPKDLVSTTSANYLGPMRLTLALLPGMRSAGHGHIVNMSTVGVMFPVVPKWGFYLSSKAAFDWWIRAVAMEARTDGVTLTSIYAGLMHTRMSAPSRWMGALPGQSPEQAARVIAKAVVAKPRTLAPAYGYLSSVLVPPLRTPLDIVIGGIYRKLGDTQVSLDRVRAGGDRAE
ncbi:SDR family NAD(P)-dependent oxidoreductase [Nocardia inohanensis]|uniref:SDR family NAD(P)-dependent oxidoreductase n=1 Tax=Nocardia inohanensis TaxID=209246 RepID=UPI00082ECEC5|nr:SDR family NAD(P)-dependent oxidoreductase [Nocardia inohanensis]